MQLRNKHGTPVDPVPFLVVSVTAVAVIYSWGLTYLLELGLTLQPAFVTCGVAVLGSTAASYHRYIWNARPELRAEVPALVRFKRLIYAMLISAGLLALLALPLVVQ